MPSAYSSGERSGAAEAGEMWWKGFNDARLDSLIAEAFADNLDITAAYARMNQARAAVGVAASTRLPSLGINAGGGRVRQSTLAGAVESDTYSLSAAAGYEVDLFRRLKARVDAARYDYLAAGEDLSAIHISISAQVADLYYLAVESRAQLKLAESAIAAFEDTLGRVERRYAFGLVPALDVYQSRQNLASARASRPVFASRLEVTEHALSVLLGRAPAHGFMADPDAGSGEGVGALPAPPEIGVGIPSSLLARRPDIRAAYLRLEASDRRVAAAVADRMPTFNLVGDFGGASNNVSTLLDSPNILWNLLMQAALPVIDGGRRRAEVDRAEAVFDGSLAAYRSVILRSLAEVEDALSLGRGTTERITMLEARAAASGAALRLSLDRYMQGLSDYLPVLTAQQGYYDAESALIGARRDLISNRIQLARALGGDWPSELKGRDRALKGRGGEPRR
jgi:NodT family efflux transporter outer membrane factor (OMF) lipoprotein